jgi:hypothetical protein
MVRMNVIEGTRFGAGEVSEEPFVEIGSTVEGKWIMRIEMV